MAQKERSCFQLYHNFFNQFALLELEDRGALITAIFQYAKHQRVEIELSPLVKMAFSCIQDALDRDLEHYLEKCKQNTENGKKGGRPKKDLFLPKTEGFSEQPKKADTDTDTEKDTETKTKTDTDMDTELDTEFRSAPFGAPVCASKESRSALPLSEPAPLTASAPISDAAPRLEEEDYALLLEKGVPREYLDERLERAERYAQREGKTVFAVLLDWWHSDRKDRKWTSNRSKARAAPQSVTANGIPIPGCSFDEEDFFQAALERSFRARRSEGSMSSAR